MPPGAKKRPTGTVPKAKTPRKNSVPQEMVAPTRRDFQQHLNDFFASVQRVSSKSVDAPCLDLDNLSLPENTSQSCWPPVRPIPRRNFVQHENDSNLLSTVPSSAAIGVVTPNSTLHHQQQNHINEQLFQHNNITTTAVSPPVTANYDRSWSYRRAPKPTRFGYAVKPKMSSDDSSRKHISAQTSTAKMFAPTARPNVEDRLDEIQDYIRVTTSLLDSIQNEKTTMDPHPQTVVSVPNSPTYEEVQSKLDTSSRNILQIKEQQQQLLRLQQAARKDLYEMEQMRLEQSPLSFINSGAGSSRGGDLPPDYVSEADVANDMRVLMSRMKNLSEFVRNQNDWATSLGIDDNDKSKLMEEQLQLQKKLLELKSKKHQMASLVNELQVMNAQAENNFDGDANATATAIPATSHHDIDTNGVYEHNHHHHQHQHQHSHQQHDPIQSAANYLNLSAEAAKCPNESSVEVNDNMSDDDEDDDNNNNHNDDDDDNNGEEEAIGGNRESVLHGKIAEINAMKEQLKRLQDMMHTVKLIDIKNGDCVDPYADAVSDVVNAHTFNESNASAKPLNDASVTDDPQRDEVEEREMVERVRALHNMTNDLRQQAVSLAAERDRLKTIKNEMSRRRETVGHAAEEKNFKQQQMRLVAAPPVLSSSLSQLKMSKENLTNDNNSHIKNEQLAVDPQLLFAAAAAATRNSRERRQMDAADVLSLKSESSRGFSVPPPMRNIKGRDGPWRKTSHDMQSHNQSLADQNSPGHNSSCYTFDNPAEQSSPWYWHRCATTCSGPPAISMLRNGGTSANDTVVLQQFIQTQQMLINSMSQCNQLLWEQQREINNLNSTVLLLQERLLNTTAVNTNLSRAESIAPNEMCTTANEFFPRAQSEQPMFQQYRQYASPSNIHQIPAMYRGMAANSNTGNALPPRQNTLLNANAVAAAAAAGGGVSGNVARGYFDGKNEDFCYFLGDRRPVAAENNHNHNNNINNNLNNNVSNITNQLNNQITPLNPPLNNYADNFRSYSRQNLLCSSKNEDVYNTLTNASSSQSGHRERSSEHSLPYAMPYSGRNVAATASVGPSVNCSETNTMNNSLHTVVNNINSFNLDLNEAKTPKAITKTVQKCSTGGSKRARSSCTINASDRENNLTASPLSSASISTATNHIQTHDPNLATITNTKASTKLFDDLKENVYLEVSALIAANESRPHFLINLFRELQHISSSDPLRKRLMEAFQELYTNHCETSPITSINVQNDLENPQQDTTQLCMSDLQSSLDGRFLRSIMMDIRECIAHQQPMSNELSETVLQRIASIILRYFNNIDTNIAKPSIGFDEIVGHLFRLERQNNEKFLAELQHYLSFVLFTTQSTEQCEPFDRCSLFTFPTNGPATNCSKQQSTSIDNQDLTEADQCNHPEIRFDMPPTNAQLDENLAVNGMAKSDEAKNVGFATLPIDENDISVDMVSDVDVAGAVGGTSQLPDLAIVTTNSSRVFAFKDDAIDAERERDREHARRQHEMSMNHSNSPDVQQDTDGALSLRNGNGKTDEIDIIASVHENVSKAKNDK